jgi:hypothetical protein
MRSGFGAKQVNDYGFGADFDLGSAERRSSPDQLAVVWTPEGGVVVASPLTGSARGGSKIDLARFPNETDIAATISLRRTRDFGLPPISRSTQLLTVVADHSERTRILALDGEKLSYDDSVLLEWLVNAEKQMLLGTDNHPVFESSLEDTSCGIARLPNGQVSMTEVPRNYISSLITNLRTFAREPSTSLTSVCVETPLRCIARYFLSLTKEGIDTLHQGRRGEVTAFISMNMSGYSYGLWSPTAGLFSEIAFLAPVDVTKKTRARSRRGEVEPVDPNHEERSINEYVRKALDQLTMQMSDEKLESLQLSGYSQVVYTAEKELFERIGPISAEISESTGIEFIPLDVPMEEAMASGLLLGSYSFGSDSVSGALTVQPVNLARDVLVLADTEETERLREEEFRNQNRRNRVVTTVLAPPVIVAGVLFALVASLLASYVFTTIREARADAKAQELKPALERRKAYEANLKWYQDFISQVSRLRRQQPVGIGLLRDLNSNYPFAIDPSFYVSDMKLSQNGDLEMKGLAKNKDAVATFLKALEFAGGEQSGSRLFNNLAYEIQELGQPTPQAAVNVPRVAGSTLTAANAGPGIVQWRMTGNFAPVAEFLPKQAAKPGTPPQPGASPAAQPTVAPKPAA